MKTRALFLSTLVLLASGCQQQRVEISAKDKRRMDFAVPENLLSKTVDLNNPASVAKAMNKKLSGDPKQHLYDIYMTAPSSEGVLEKRTIPIRVDNIKQGSSIIYSVQGSNYEPPAKQTVAKPSAKKPKKKK